MDLSVDVVPSMVEEEYLTQEPPEELVCRIGLQKAIHIGFRLPDRLVIGADTVVVMGNRILGKPSDLSHAKRMLRFLSGKTHTVMTGVALVKHSRNESYTFSERTDVTFRNLNDRMIDYYVENGKPLDKAGGYAIQDWSACFVESISGCYNNVMGFPLSRFIQVLRDPDIERAFGPYNWFGKVGD